MKRVLLVVLALLFLGGGAWAVAARVESPDQVAARAKAPEPDPVVAPLSRGYVNGSLSMSVRAQYEQTIALRPPSAVTGVVTSAGKGVGDTVKSGSVLLRANGRPLFTLTGAFALYRDIEPGDNGDDVAAVQASLKQAGFSLGRDRVGTYGSGTQAAVQKMYRAAGFDAPMTPTVAAAPDVPPKSDHGETPEQPATPDASAETDGGQTPEQTAKPEPPGEAASPGTPGEAASPGTPAEVDVAARTVVATNAGGAMDAKTTNDPVCASQNQNPGQSGPCVLRTEVMMIAQLPAVVQAIAPVGAQLGSEVDLVTLATGRVLLSATLPAGSLGALTVGAMGTFADDAGADGSAEVTAIGPGASAAETIVSLSPSGSVTVGNPYVLAVENPAAESGDSLLAPIAAVVDRGGRSYIYVRDDGVFREVEVTVTAVVGGVAAIVPMDSGVPLDQGTEVRLG